MFLNSYFTPEKLLGLLLEETVDDSYHADFLLTYRTFLTSPGEIFDKLLTSWNETAEVYDQVMMSLYLIGFNIKYIMFFVLDN